VIATFVLSLKGSGLFRPSINLVIIFASLIILYRIAMNQRFAKKLTQKTRETLRAKFHFERVHIEEILSQSEGYGIVSILVGEESRLSGLTLNQSGLRDADLTVLSIEKDEEMIPVPKASIMIQAGDRLICYGKIENVGKFV
jgi:K+/H+ antiporter YhaU regulatory subunit KhtT